MINTKKYLKELIEPVIYKEFEDAKNLDWHVDIAQEGFGDYTLTLPFQLAKIRKESPINIASKILDAILKQKFDVFKNIEIKSPGYLNIFLSSHFYLNFLEEIEDKKDTFLDKPKKNKKVQVEFVSANPTGPLHVGNGRGAVIGSALYELLKIQGFDVQREYYINDYGSKMKLFAASIEAEALKILNIPFSFPEEGYKGEYIKDIAKTLVEGYKDKILSLDKEGRLKFFEEEGKSIILKSIKDDLEDFGIIFDNWFSERSLYETKTIDETLEVFKKRGVVYEKDSALWLKATDFGDDKDRVLIRSNGEPTYTMADASYHFNKFKRGFEKVIDIWGQDHIGHILPMQALIHSLGLPSDFLDIIIYQIVHFIREGEKVTLSKQSGDIVTLKDLVNETGKDAARFFFLLKSIDQSLDFDISLALKKSIDNPVYYVQYTHARLNSVLKKAKEKGKTLKSIEKVDLSILNTDEEMAILKFISSIQDEIDSLSLSYGVHRIAYLTLEFSKLINSFYQKHKILESEEALENARLSFVNILILILKKLFETIDIKAPDTM